MREKVLDFLKQNKIKYRISGDEVEIGCILPNCPNTGEPQLYINAKTSAFMCHRCGGKGNNLSQLAFKAGLITFKEPTKAGGLHISDKQVSAWHTALLANAGALGHLTQERGLELRSIVQFQLGYEPSNGNMHEHLIIPYFDEDQICVGYKKYFFTNPQNISKCMFAKDSKVQLYNINCINLEEPLIITEGELDTITAWQYGFTNVGSMPNGAQGLGDWVEVLKTVPQLIICSDNDRAGEEAANKIGDIVGLSKCIRATPRLKDLNEYAKCGLSKEEVEKVFKTGVSMFEAPISNISSYVEDSKNLLANPSISKGVPTGWNVLDFYIGGIRTGEVTVTSGMTGHGKTTFAEALITNICEDLPALIVSPEMSEVDILMKLASSFHGRQVTTSEQIDQFAEAIGDRIQIAKVFDSWTERKKTSLIDRVFDLIEFSARNRGTKFVLLDHLHLFLNPAEQEGERFLIDTFMKRCVHSAISNNIHIWLVVQPRGLPANQRKVTIHDLKGSSAISQDAHNIVLIHRNMSEQSSDLVEVEIGKNRKLGTCGLLHLKFDLESRANYYDIES